MLKIKNLTIKSTLIIVFALSLFNSSLLNVLASNYESIKSSNEIKRVWSDEEIIELGYVPDEILVKFKEDKINLKSTIGKDKFKQFLRDNSKSLSSEIITNIKKNPEKAARFSNISAEKITNVKNNFFKEGKKMEFINSAVLKLAIDDSVYETIDKLRQDPNIERVIPNYIFTFDTDIYDPEYTGSNQWGVEKIELEDAMSEMTGEIDDVIVAVLDSGLSYDHPEFGSENLWDGSASCKDENNIAIQGGCDNYGWDFSNDDDDPLDDNGHGTHVAGIIGAMTNNQDEYDDYIGIAGVSQNVKLMVIKVGTSYGKISDAISGIYFAKNNNAKIINASWGGYYEDINSHADLKTAIANFLSLETLFIASAGNEANDNDSVNRYPVGYGFDKIISVAATNSSDVLSTESNWGEESVDISAPGFDITSTDIQNRYNSDITLISLGLESPWNISDSKLLTNTSTYGTDIDADATKYNLDLSGDIEEDSVAVSFNAWCDTEPTGTKDDAPDYIEVSVSTDDGTNWNVLQTEDGVTKINEEYLAVQEIYDGYTGAINTVGLKIPSTYFTDDTDLRFRWVTDSGDIGGSYRGCYIENIHLNSLDDGETGQDSTTYESRSGTSMAAPFVTGVAAMIWGKYPDLTASQVKEIIMDSSDDISSENPNKPTVSDGRLNAYEAMLLADTVANPSVPTTIESVAGGGYWTNTSTWVGGVVPSSIDSVIINGNVTLNTNATVEDLTVNSGKVFKNQSNNNYTLTVNGDLTNDGTMQDATYHLIVTVGGNVDNNGTLENYSLTITGDLDNSGTLSVNTYLAGDLVHSGTHDNDYLYMNGASTQSITASEPLYKLSIQNDTVVTGDLTVASYLYVQSGKTLTFGSENTITVTGASGANNAGTVEGGAVAMSGDAQNFFGAGTWDVDSVTFSGTGVKSVQTTTITGDVTVGADAVIRNQSNNNYTLTVNGDLTNDGTMQDATYHLIVTVGGNVDNNGTLENYSLTITGDLDNSGTLSVNTYLAGDLVHSGTHDNDYLYMNGASTQSITASEPLYKLSIQNDTVVTGDLTLAYYLFVLSGKTLTFGTENTLTITGASGANNAGTVEGGAVAMSGDAQNFFGAGTWDVDSVTFSGTGTKTVQTTTITGDVTVGASAILRPNSVHRTLTINGDLTNNGTIEDYSGDRIYIYLGSDLDNNGTMNNYATYADWEEVGGADSYDFQYTDTGDVWQTEVSTGTNTHYSITAFETDDRRWRWRSVEDSTPSAWSSDKYIN